MLRFRALLLATCMIATAMAFVPATQASCHAIYPPCGKATTYLPCHSAIEYSTTYSAAGPDRACWVYSSRSFHLMGGANLVSSSTGVSVTAWFRVIPGPEWAGEVVTILARAAPDWGQAPPKDLVCSNAISGCPNANAWGEALGHWSFNLASLTNDHVHVPFNVTTGQGSTAVYNGLFTVYPTQHIKQVVTETTEWVDTGEGRFVLGAAAGAVGMLVVVSLVTRFRFRKTR